MEAKDAENCLKFVLDRQLMWAIIVYEVEQKGRKWSFRPRSKGKNTPEPPFVTQIFRLRIACGTKVVPPELNRAT